MKSQKIDSFFQKESWWCWKRWRSYILMAAIPNFLV